MNKTTTKAERHYPWYALRMLALVITGSIGATMCNLFLHPDPRDRSHCLIIFMAWIGIGTIAAIALGALAGYVFSKSRKEKFEMWFWKSAWYFSVVYATLSLTASLGIIAFGALVAAALYPGL